MDNASDSIHQNLKKWILDDGICATASFISTSWKIPMDQSKSILMKFYNDNKSIVDATFLVYKKKIKQAADGTDYVHYEGILESESELNGSEDKDSLGEDLGKILYAVQPEGVKFCKDILKRDFLGLISDFGDDGFYDEDEDDESLQSGDVKSSGDCDPERSPSLMDSDSDKEKGKKRKRVDYEKEKVNVCDESSKKIKVSEEIKKEEILETVGKKHSNTKTKSIALKENRSTVDLSTKEVVTENFVDDEGFLVTKSAVKTVSSQPPKENLVSKPQILKTKSEPAKGWKNNNDGITFDLLKTFFPILTEAT
uniref:NUC153 domain-containing protein n=1 Tax=Strongyloides venezuelensis TaxID=75913 RepID=A0A0K0FKJ4_STRVS